MFTEPTERMDPQMLALVVLALVFGVLLSAAVLAPNAPGAVEQASPIVFHSR